MEAYFASAGTADPTRAPIALHLAADGSMAVDQETAIIVGGDAAELPLVDNAETLEGVGVPPIRDLLRAAPTPHSPNADWCPSSRNLASASPTACSRSRPPPTPSTSGPRSRSSPVAWPARCAATRSSTRTRCAMKPNHLRHRAHERLMRAFLDPEVFSGGVPVVDDEPAEAQTRLTV